MFGDIVTVLFSRNSGHSLALNVAVQVVNTQPCRYVTLRPSSGAAFRRGQRQSRRLIHLH